MSRFASENDRVTSLLADAASGGLDARSANELATLLGPDAAAKEIEAAELAAAALDLALIEEAGSVGSLEAMPAGLAASVAGEAMKYVGASANTESLRLARREDDVRLPAIAAERAPATVGRGTGGSMAWAGWLAAAAAIVLAASAWLPRMSTVAPGSGGGGGVGAMAQRSEVAESAAAKDFADSTSQDADNGAPPMAAKVAAKSDARLRDVAPAAAPAAPAAAFALAPPAAAIDELKSKPGTIEIAWKPLPDETCKEKCSGRIVWNNELQRGYMTFRGLAVNDPAKFQYQLWVFDSAQKHPIDGGVFDISAARAGVDGEVIVPVVAKIRVDSPQAFAVTIEKPGGVVVSDQTRIATLAPVTKG